MANSDTKTCLNNFNLPISPKRIGTKSSEEKMKIIVECICALFNTGGGQLTIDFEEKPCSLSEIDDCLKRIEQRVQNLTSTATVSDITVTKSENEIIMSIPTSSRLVVLTSNLYLPGECEVLLLPPTEPVENVKKILQGNAAKTNPTTFNSHCKQFFKNQDVGFGESKVAQLKLVKTKPTKNVTVAKRICGETNRFCPTASAFANHSGGHIYVGVKEDGIVIGENLCEKDKGDIIKEVNKAFKKMVWPSHIVEMGGPRKGEHWEVFFEPVRDDEGHVIPSLFVVVVFIAQCPGGVFAEKPESHHIVNNKVKRMSFSEWLLHFQDHPNSAPLQVSLVAQPISNEVTYPDSHGAFTETPESSGVLRGQVPLPSLPEHSSHFQDRSSSTPLQVPRPVLPISSELTGRGSDGAFAETPESSQVINGQLPLPSFPEQPTHFQDRSSSTPLQVPPVLLTSSDLTGRGSHGAFAETPESSGVLNGQVPLSSFPEQPTHFQDRSSSTPLQVPPVLLTSSDLTGRGSHGAFAETPESSGVLNGQVPLSSFPEQPTHFQDRSSSAPLQVPPVLPTSSELAYSNDFTELCKQYRNNENKCEEALSALVAKEKLKNPRGNALRLMVLSEKVIVAYKKHNFEKAEQRLHEFEELLKSSKKDAEQLRPKARYLKSCLESAKGNYENSFEIATDGLEEMELIHPELISSKDQIDFYLHTAMLATILHCKQGEVEIYRAHEYLEKASGLAEVSKVSPDLLQKLHIYKACVLLRCSLTGESSHSSCVSEKDIETAISELLAVVRIVLEGHPLSQYRKAQLLLVMSALFYRHGHQYTTRLECAFEKAKEAKALAKKCHFNEMALYASKRIAVITQEIIRVHFSK